MYSGLDAAAKEQSVLPYPGDQDDDRSRQHFKKARRWPGPQGEVLFYSAVSFWPGI